VPADHIESGILYQELPEVSGRVHPNRRPIMTLAARLVPIVDKIRQLNTDFGLRPYRVHLIHQKWSGARIGEGSSIEISRHEILPTPKVSGMSSTSEILRATGLTEEGTISVSEISARFTEDDLMGRTPDLIDPAVQRTGARNVEFFWEVSQDGPSTPLAERRRFVPNAVPVFDAGKCQWDVSLAKQDYDLSRLGTSDPRSR
jgi:hypothetical protein